MCICVSLLSMCIGVTSSSIAAECKKVASGVIFITDFQFGVWADISCLTNRTIFWCFVFGYFSYKRTAVFIDKLVTL